MSKLKEHELSSILRFGLTYEQLNQYDVLCLPENLANVSNVDELYDATDAITLSKLLKSNGINCANSFDLKLPAQILERRSKEKWFGIVYVRNNIAIPILVGVLSTLITNVISEGQKENDAPVPKIHIELKIEKRNTVVNLKYDGDAPTFITILKSIEADTTSKK